MAKSKAAKELPPAPEPEATPPVAAASPTSNSSSLSKNTILFPLAFIIAMEILKQAYRIRLMAINDFGTVIHEFDPYFNLRATEVS